MNPSDIKRIRGALGLTQDAFAFAVGVRQATVSNWEQGKRKPSRLAEREIKRLVDKSANTGKPI